MKTRLGRPSPSMVVSVIALIVALGGTATAATVLIRSSAQIKNGVVTGADLKDATITGRDVKDGALTGAALRAGTIDTGKLDAGVRETLSAAATSAQEAFRKAGPENVPGGKSERVITLSGLEPGVYAIFSKAVITVTRNSSGLLKEGESSGGHCVLNAAGDTDESRTLLTGVGSSSPGVVVAQITRTLGTTADVTLDCDASGTAPWRASDSSIIAIRLGSAPRTPVSG